MSEDKIFFSAIFERAESRMGNIQKSGYYLKDVRTRTGDLIKKHMIAAFSIEDQERLEKLGSGDYVAFLADVELKNIELQGAHGV